MGQGPSQPKPGTKFRVIGAGMSRTGTKSFSEALTILLDAPVHDAGVESIGGPKHHRKNWMEVMRLAPNATTPADDKKVDALLHKLLDGYCATVDVPANLLTPELLRVYPDAVVIATTRDSASWYRSLQRMVAMTTPTYVHIIVYWIPVFGDFRKHFLALQKVFMWRLGTKELRITDLQRHEDMIRECVPADKLIWYEVRDGWAPLCKALNVPIPDRPFPHNNKPDDGVYYFRYFMIFGLSLWALVLGAVYLVGYMIWNQFFR